MNDPYAAHQPAPQAPYRPPSPPSAIPRVVGILAIIFSVIGLLGSFTLSVGIAGVLDDKGIPYSALGTFGTWNVIFGILGLALFGLHLTGGILGVKYSRLAPRFITIYALLAIAIVAADIAFTATTLPNEVALKLDDQDMARYAIEVIALPWPIIALSLINTRRAKDACADPARDAVANRVFD